MSAPYAPVAAALAEVALVVEQRDTWRAYGLASDALRASALSSSREVQQTAADAYRAAIVEIRRVDPGHAPK